MSDNQDAGSSQRTLVLLKPDCIQRGLIGEILCRFEKKGLKVVGLKMVELDDALLATHYSHLVGRPFYKRLASFMKSSPVVAICLEGFEAVRMVRDVLVGNKSNGRDNPVGTIRGDYSISSQANLVHASDSEVSALDEVQRFFDDEDLFEYDRLMDSFIYSPDECSG